MTELAHHPTLYADIARHAQERPDAIAVTDGARDVSYFRFAKDIEMVSRRLFSMQLPAISLVAISVQQPYLHWLVLIGLWRIGIASFSVDRGSETLKFNYFNANILITDHDLASEFQAPRIRVGDDWLVEDDVSFPPFVDHALNEDKTLRLAVSSGTTGTPKCSAFTKRVIDARLARVRRNPRFNTSICFMSLVNVASVEFFFSVGAWSVGGTVEFCQQPIIEALEKGDLKASLLFMNTSQLCDLVNALPAGRRPNKSLIVLVGGSTVPRDVYKKALERLAGSVMIVYGSTEAGSVAFNPNPLEYHEPGVCGFVVPEMEVQAINDAGHPVGEGALGEIRIRSTSCVSSYVDDPVMSATTFRDGWFYPGDLGKLGKNGLLTIVGRVDEVMNIGGWKVAPELIEEALFSCVGLKDLAVCAVPDAQGSDQVWVAVVRGEGFVQTALTTLWNSAGVPAGKSLNIAYVDVIPRNTRGKTVRFELVDLIKRHRMLAAVEPDHNGPTELNKNGSSIKIKDREFDIEKLSVSAKAQVASLCFVDDELQRLTRQIAVFQAARIAYSDELNKMLVEGTILLQ